MRGTAELNDTINTMLELQVATTAMTFAHLAAAGVLTHEEAARRLRTIAQDVDLPWLRAPIVGKAMAKSFANLADAIERGESGGPLLEVIQGGRAD